MREIIEVLIVEENFIRIDKSYFYDYLQNNLN